MRKVIVEWFNVLSSQTSQTRLVKSGRSNLDTKSSRKATLVVRRLIDVKGFHTGTDVDIKSKRIAKVLQEYNPDVEGVSLTAVPLQVRTEVYWRDHNSVLPTFFIMTTITLNRYLGTGGVLLPQLVRAPAAAGGRREGMSSRRRPGGRPQSGTQIYRRGL